MNPISSKLLTPENAYAVLAFWFDETKSYQWFRRDNAFDQSVRDRFGALHEAAAAGDLDPWLGDHRLSLALIILLDQFSRNIYRDQPAAFAQDAQALNAAREAIDRGHDRLHGSRKQSFFYMPFMHAEDLSVQEESVALFQERMPETDNLPYAKTHRDIIRKFGRFPHRNKVLGRESTEAELEFLNAGGFNP